MWKWLRKFWAGEQAEGVFVPASAVKEPEVIIPPERPLAIGEGVKCICETILNHPKRFRFKFLSIGTFGGETKGSIWDRELQRAWKFTYCRPSRHGGPARVEVDGLVLTPDESTYLIENLKGLFTTRLTRNWQILQARQNRKLQAARDELHKLYCTGGVCVTN